MILLAPFLTLVLAGQAQAQEWEFRVCADPSSLPFSNQQEEGFENEIAQLLADEMGATLTYDWYPQTADMITFRLRGGECDAIIGVPDGTYEILTTVAYYRSPYVFLYRASAPFEIESLDDPVLGDLRIAVQNVGIPPHDSLVYRGLSENVVTDYLEGEPRLGPGRSRAVVDAVINGEVDVALVWGPVAGYLAQQTETELIVQPVTPEFEPPFRTQSFPMTIGVRPGDEALRDRLDIALANSWEEVNEILQRYGVPTSPLPQPVVSPPPEGIVRVGFVTPTITGTSAIPQSLWDVAGDAATNGALLAESDLVAQAPDSELELDVLFASTPSAAAAQRAADRLALTDDVFALVGGLGDGQAEALRERALTHDLLFFNIGDPRLERQCTPNVFHIEANYSAYLGALIDQFSSGDETSWFVVHEDLPEGGHVTEWATSEIERRANTLLAGRAPVQREQPSYFEVLADIEESGADAVLLLVNARDQIAFMGQMYSQGIETPVAPFPDPVTQTREFLAATMFTAGEEAAGERVLLWETTLEEGQAGDLNDRYMGRYGEPMDPPAWAAHAAVTILHEVVNSTGSTTAQDVSGYLEQPEVAFALGKGVPLGFDVTDHQLQQPLFVVEMNPEAQWGLRLAGKLAVAELVGSVPSLEAIAASSADEIDWPGSPADCAVSP